MTNLTRFDSTDGIELVIDTRTGEAFATQSGYARMSGLTQQAINKRCRGYNQDELKNAEVDLGYGLQGYNLIPAKLVYRWLTKDNPELSLAMGEAGATVYLHQLAGFKVSSDAVANIPVTETKPELTPAKLDLLRSALSSLSAPLVDGFILNQVQAYYPELKPAVEEGHRLLAATNPITEILLTPTAIGKRLGVSARVVNAILTDNEFQIKNPTKGKTEPAYLPTEKGKEYSSNTLATGRGSDNTSYQHTKWNESIVEVVKGLL